MNKIGTITDKLQYTAAAVDDIQNALSEKGVSITKTDALGTYGNKIREIKAGGGVDTSDATATADKILKGYTAYAKGIKLVGTMPDSLDVLGIYYQNLATNFGTVPIEIISLPVVNPDINWHDIILHNIYYNFMNSASTSYKFQTSYKINSAYREDGGLIKESWMPDNSIIRSTIYNGSVKKELNNSYLAFPQIGVITLSTGICILAIEFIIYGMDGTGTIRYTKKLYLNLILLIY